MNHIRVTVCNWFRSKYSSSNSEFLKKDAPDIAWRLFDERFLREKTYQINFKSKGGRTILNRNTTNKLGKCINLGAWSTPSVKQIIRLFQNWPASKISWRTGGILKLHKPNIWFSKIKLEIVTSLLATKRSPSFAI